jgi:hypothetical protein
MPPQLYFFVSVVLSLIAWSLVVKRYIWPRLKVLTRAEALQPILVLHSFRFIGLAFLVSGVVSPDLPSAFAKADAYGDFGAAVLALLAMAALPMGSIGIAIAWIFNIWGTVDLLDAFYQGNAVGLIPGQLGATYFIPTLIVPLLLITHALAFRILLSHPKPVAAGQQAV